MELGKSADVKLVDDADLNTARFDHPVKALDTSPQECGQVREGFQEENVGRSSA